jgi:Na+-translocating ferredoxin:NAD+ oxidoreductase RNF subunit RnfB
MNTIQLIQTVVPHTAIFIVILSLVLGVLLCVFRKVFHVEEDVLALAIRAELPGANCGACGFPGCDGFANSAAKGDAPANGCVVGGAAVAEKLAKLLGDVAAAGAGKQIAVLSCRGDCNKAPLKGKYVGVNTCQAAKISANGVKLCAWGCIGYGDCTQVCKFGAISMGPDGLPVIDKSKCTGCGMCVKACPQKVLALALEATKGPYMFCSNRNTEKAGLMKTCKAACIKCEMCVKNCPQKALVMENGLPKVDRTLCNNCGTCYTKCPTKAIAAFPA